MRVLGDFQPAPRCRHGGCPERHLSRCIRRKSTKEIIMSGRLGPAIAVLAVLVVVGKSASTQTVEPTNSAPNRIVRSTIGRNYPRDEAGGSTAGVDIDPDGSSVWVFERCGTFALPSERKPGGAIRLRWVELAPILKFDACGQAGRQLRRGDVRVSARRSYRPAGTSGSPTPRGEMARATRFSSSARRKSVDDARQGRRRRGRSGRIQCADRRSSSRRTAMSS